MARPAMHEAPLFGQNLAKLRKEHGYSQEKFAGLVGLSIKTIDYYERRAENPNSAFVKKAAELLGATPDQLLGIESPKKKPGPSPKLLKLFEELQKAPKSKQQFAVQFLETLLKTE